MPSKLRSGYTTGACAAAAAKAATLCLLRGIEMQEIEIPFPDGQRVTFQLSHLSHHFGNKPSCYAEIIKDAGDDPDVTNGAAIGALVYFENNPQTLPRETIIIRGGKGVGTVTKPGLAVAVGEPAINPVPRNMIRAAVCEAVEQFPQGLTAQLVVEIVVPKGNELAEKTLNARLGIIGGISILGTTGIVRPVSAEAWTATITSAMDVAAAGGNDEVVLSTGRTSEAALQATKQFKPEAFLMMGDYLEFALQESRKYPFTRLHMAGMWAKTVKAAMRIPQTHVRFGALEIVQAIDVISRLAPECRLHYLSGANTAREIYERLVANGDHLLVERVCEKAREYHQEMSGKAVSVYLVHHTGRIIATVE